MKYQYYLGQYRATRFDVIEFLAEVLADSNGVDSGIMDYTAGEQALEDLEAQVMPGKVGSVRRTYPGYKKVLIIEEKRQYKK